MFVPDERNSQDKLVYDMLILKVKSAVDPSVALSGRFLFENGLLMGRSLVEKDDNYDLLKQLQFEWKIYSFGP